MDYAIDMFFRHLPATPQEHSRRSRGTKEGRLLSSQGQQSSNHLELHPDPGLPPDRLMLHRKSGTAWAGVNLFPTAHPPRLSADPPPTRRLSRSTQKESKNPLLLRTCRARSLGLLSGNHHISLCIIDVSFYSCLFYYHLWSNSKLCKKQPLKNIFCLNHPK